MGFSREVAVGIKALFSIISIFILIMEWRKYRRIVKYGVCYTATVVGFKGYFIPCTIVQFNVNGKVVEDKLSCGTAQNPPLGGMINVYYWEEYYDEIISETDSNGVNSKFLMVIFCGLIFFSLWTFA